MKKTFIIEEKFVGYADIPIEAETEEEAMRIYRNGDYTIYDQDDNFYDYEFVKIRTQEEYEKESYYDGNNFTRESNKWKQLH